MSTWSAGSQGRAGQFVIVLKAGVVKQFISAEYGTAQSSIVHYIILHNGILKSEQGVYFTVHSLGSIRTN